jgi:hypothetical protein
MIHDADPKSATADAGATGETTASAADATVDAAKSGEDSGE